MFLETLFYIVLSAYTTDGSVLHANWNMPFENENICGYYLRNMDTTEQKLPFEKDEMGNYVIYHKDKTYYVEFWSHSCEEFYYDEETKKWKQVPNTI